MHTSSKWGWRTGWSVCCQVQRVSFPLSQYVPEGAVNFLHPIWCLMRMAYPMFIWVEVFNRSIFQHLLMQIRNLTGYTCDSPCMWPNSCTVYATLRCEFYMDLKKIQGKYTANRCVSCFAVHILHFISFCPQVIRCAVGKQLKSALFLLLSLWIQISSLGAQHLMQASAIKPFPMAFTTWCHAAALFT